MNAPPRQSGLWWWIDRWRKSSAYMDLNLEEQGAYRNLLDEARLRGGFIPDNEDVLAKACGDTRAWSRISAKVMAPLSLQADGWHSTDAVTTPAPWPPRIASRRRRPHIPLWIQRFVINRDATCRFCGSMEHPELDHVIRRRDGGRDTIENLRILCRPCNRRRG
jgi:HNH endonuclease/Protein of unknown function (DUF1376)